MTELSLFEYEHDGLVLKGQIARPAGPGPHPAVLVMHDAMGLGENCRNRAVALAQAGYVALATDMYGTGQAHPELEEHSKLFLDIQADPARMRARVVAGYDALRALPDVDAGRIGAIGYCFGGQCVLELARSGANVAAVVSFHGLLTTHAPAAAGAVKGGVLVITGALDPYVLSDSVRHFETEMSDAGAEWQITTYGKGWHAFTDPSVGNRQDIPGVRYDPLLDRLSWAQATAFLDAALRG